MKSTAGRLSRSGGVLKRCQGFGICKVVCLGVKSTAGRLSRSGWILESCQGFCICRVIVFAWGVKSTAGGLSGIRSSHIICAKPARTVLFVSFSRY